MTAAIFHGFILALGLIIPLGVQNFFIFSQGATKSKLIYVLPITITASLCDTLLIVLAVSGVSVVVLNFVWMKTILVLCGSLFLLYMGYMTWKAKPQKSYNNMDGIQKNSKLIAYTIMISILNPHAIIDTIGVIGTSSLNYEGSEKLVFTLSCVTVSWIWFFLLTLLGRLVGSKDHSGNIVLLLNKVSAIVMWVAAVILLVSILS
ncbi:LysE/ArgO family amino acid transporter [Cohnella sp.]|uniref:LysE/ArgO family amino acid transporter n=1 Tax=Cohnella sp. TaxID=1883426 RepID=UPI003568B70A